MLASGLIFRNTEYYSEKCNSRIRIESPRHIAEATMDTETFELLRSSVRRFVDERLIPAEDQVEADDAVPDEIVADMRELGLFGLTIPEQYGGLGLNVQEEAGVIHEPDQGFRGELHGRR